VTENRNEKRDARKIAKHLDIQYTRALRWLRAGKYVVHDGQVERGPNYDGD
jgi:phage antirepressor YoqD-like protein